MSEVDIYRGTEVELASEIAVRRLAEWAQSAQAAHAVAAELVRTSFVPDAFRGKAHEATAAILAGLECGLQPMAALRSFDIIQGQAAPRALTLRAIVQSYGHEMVLEESTATRCKMRGRRRGAHEWQTVTWTVDRARSLNLLGKDNWRKQPQAMLVARATSELARLVAADAILGIGYSSEEISDGAGAGVDIPPLTDMGEVALPAASGTKRMSRKQTPKAEEPSADTDLDANVADGEVIDTEQPDVNGPPITDKQHRMLMALLSGAGLKEHDDYCAYISDVIGRTVDSSKAITVAEGSAVIDALKQGDAA